MQPTLAELEELACQAGEILRSGFGSRPGFNHEHEVAHKGVIDLVTEMDRRTEEFLLGEIRRRFPDHSAISEESGSLTGSLDQRWFIDPLDGTVNYAHGVPIYSVSIAYAQDGEIQMGVVYDPMQEECFSAELGRGARLNGEPVRVSSTTELDQCLLVTGFPYDIRTNPENNLEYFARFSLLTQGVRRLGSAALDLCYVAAGRFDGFWEIRLSPWDVAAGGLIAREAGAIITDIHGAPDYLSSPQSILAANPDVHRLMLAVIHAA